MIRAAGLEQLVRSVTSARRDDRARPAAAGRRARPAAARRRRAGDARAGGRLRPRARRSCARSAAAGCTGPRARCSSPTPRRSPRSTACSARSSAIATPRRRLDLDDRAAQPGAADVRRRRRRPDRRAASAARASAGSGDDGGEPEVEVPVAMASDEERLAGKSFDALEPHELAQLYRLMSRLELVTPRAPHAPLREGPPRPAHRPAAHAARQPAHGRRPDPARPPPAPRRSAAGS